MNNRTDMEILEYEFASFQEMTQEAGTVQGFEFQEIEGMTVTQAQEKKLEINIEREYSKKNNFKVSPIVKHHRGISNQEEEERERRIQEEVERRVATIRDRAYSDGFEEGVKSGREEVFQQTIHQSEEKLESLSEMIRSVLSTKEDILEAQKKQLYVLIRTLSKWVILRELDDDGKYIERLLEKLILEIQTKKNLLIKVDQKNFELMPEVLEVVQAKLGELTNVRVETDYDIEGAGIILESENGIINGTLSEQLNSLGKLFEAVGLEEEESDEQPS